jgi:hypothetical protein
VSQSNKLVLDCADNKCVWIIGKEFDSDCELMVWTKDLKKSLGMHSKSNRFFNPIEENKDGVSITQHLQVDQFLFYKRRKQFSKSGAEMQIPISIHLLNLIIFTTSFQIHFSRFLMIPPFLGNILLHKQNMYILIKLT